MWARRDLKSRLITYLRRALSIFLVVLATCAGAYLPLAAYHQSSTLSVGEIRMSVSPGHRGALDVYVPLVDWGARFEAIRAPLRVRVDLQTVNRGVATGLAQGQSLDIDKVRAEAEQALTTYLMRLIALTVLSGAALGLLVAFAIRSRVPRLRWTAPRRSSSRSGSASRWRCSSRPAARSPTRSTTPTARTSRARWRRSRRRSARRAC